MADHRQLRPMLLEAGKGVFAVIDGAQFDDLPVALFGRHFVHEPLYTNRGNLTPDQVKTAPQLVWLDRDRKSEYYEPSAENFPIDEQILDRLFDLVEDRPAVVFWQCEAGSEALYRHLRGINMVLYPDVRYLRRTDPIPESGFDMVVLRHSDSNVMAQIAPALSWAGLSRLLGPSDALLFSPDADWAQRPFRIPREPYMPTPYSGTLRIGREEIEAIELARKQAIFRQRISYLRKTCPDETRGYEDAAIAGHIRASDQTGRELGLVSEAAHCRWAYLMVATRGEIAHSPDVVNFIRHGGTTPDEQMSLVMKSTIAFLKKQRASMDAEA